MAVRLHVTVDLELTEPVSGSLSRDDREPIAFSGWLELHSALEAICAAATDDAGVARRANRGPSPEGLRK